MSPTTSEDGPETPEHSATRDSRGAGRPVLWGALALVGLLVLAGLGTGAWALVRFLGGGPAPAEALPADTVAYAAVDLDPGGEQKVSALRTLNTFPALAEQLDMSADGDVRRRLFAELQSGPCGDLDYDEDVAGWLGNAFAVAAVSGEEQPHPVFVLEVADEAAAEDGVSALGECTGGAGGVQDGWAVLAEDEDVLATVQDGDGSLAEQEDFQQRIDDVGGEGIARAYVSADAAPALGEVLQQMPGSPLPGTPGDGGDEQLQQQLEAFQGMAASLRFESDGVTLEYAAETTGDGPSGMVSSDPGAGEVVSSLPADTVATLGIGWAEDWLGSLFERMAPLSSLLGPGADSEDLMSEAENATGLDLPEEGETLLGDTAALAVGPGIGAETLQNPDPRSLPVGLKVQGDPEAATAILDRLRSQLGEQEAALLGTETDGDTIAYGPSEEYRRALVEDGDLGGTDRFQRVLPSTDDAAALLYVDFDGEDDWVASLAREGGDEKAAANLEPLRALGISGSRTDGVSRVEVRLALE